MLENSFVSSKNRRFLQPFLRHYSVNNSETEDDCVILNRNHNIANYVLI